MRPKPTKTRKAPGRPSGSAGRPEPSFQGLSLLEDVGTIIAQSHDIQDSLERIVQVVASRMETEVCSLYIYEPKREQLTLWATEGLNRRSIGRVHMSIDEGLSGLVVERQEPVMVVDALAHARYKYFPETGEERYHSFLGVPVVERRKPLGVLVVQTLRRRRFGGEEVRLLKAIAGQVGSIIMQARLAESLESREKERNEYRERMMQAIRRLQAYERTRDGEDPEVERARHPRLAGIPAGPGFGIAPAHVLRPLVSLESLEETRSDDPAFEWERFRQALDRSIDEVEHLKQRTTDRMPEVDAKLFDTHRMMLEDRSFLARVQEHIDAGFSAETALRYTVEELVGTFGRMTDRYLRERATDVRDIGYRLLRNLLGVEDHAHRLKNDAILVGDELTLSDLAMIEPEHLRGIALATGGATSHATILAKSFEIPTVVGVAHLLDNVHDGDPMVVDGNSGVVYVKPTREIAGEYQRLAGEYRAFNRELESIRDLPAVTRDGHRIRLHANIGLLGDLAFARSHGAEGVGLYRTEFPFLAYRDFPDEEEQVRLYQKVLAEMEGKWVTIRTLDLGADKYPNYLRLAKEENPFLGWRSIRISLEMQDLFKVQLRAILRASAHGKVKLLLPMITSLDELWRAKELVEEARAELLEAGIPFDENLPLGVMVEVPAAVYQVAEIVREVDFLSLGTNDLIQYLLAVDRNNRKVAPLYEPLHPAVLRAIEQVVAAAKGEAKWVSICGEMAADPLCCPVLMGLGIDELSMGSLYIPLAKRLIRSLDQGAAREMASEVLRMASTKEIKGYLFERLKRVGVIELTEIYH